MPETDIGKLVTTDIATAMDDYSVARLTVDKAEDQKETTWFNPKWTQYFGYYKAIPELKASIDAKARWTIGKGFTADPITELILGNIKGMGKDTFNSILFNMLVVRQIGGDAYAEIILNEDGDLINLKPLDPGTMQHVANRMGQIIRFEQLDRVKKGFKRFSPEQIFYLPKNRVADEIHGVSDISAVEDIILMRNEAMADWKRVMHRNVDPLWIIHIDSDDTTKINDVKTKWEEARKGGEAMVIPKDVVVPEQVATAPNASLNALPWIDALNEYFFQATGVPDIILGSSKALTEASAKIAYLAFQQTVEDDQRFVEEQVLAQLNLEIELEFPASLEQEALSDKPKEEEAVEAPEIEPEKKAIEPNEQKAEFEGRK